MQTSFKVFVGYFRRDIKLKVIMRSLMNLFPAARSIELLEVMVGVTGHVYGAKLSFPSDAQARQALRLLSNVDLFGRRLEARTWVDRTAANERRDVNWRLARLRDPNCRRQRDRRHYLPPVMVYEQQADGRTRLRGVAPGAASQPRDAQSRVDIRKGGPLGHPKEPLVENLENRGR